MLDNIKLFMSVLGKNIRKKRLENDMTLYELAVRADLDDKHLGRIEKGQKHPFTYTLFKIARALDISVDQIFAEIDRQIELQAPEDT